MIWNVFYHNSNSREIQTFNVFKHSGFKKDVDKALKNCETIEQLEECIRHSAMYYYWSKSEWEIIMDSLASSYPKKVDVYAQLQLNWEQFIKYIWEFKSNGSNNKQRQRG